MKLSFEKSKPRTKPNHEANETEMSMNMYVSRNKITKKYQTLYQMAKIERRLTAVSQITSLKSNPEYISPKETS